MEKETAESGGVVGVGGGGGGAGGAGGSGGTVLIRPKHVYGLRTNVRNNIAFNQLEEVIYPVEGVLAFQDYVSNKQRFLRLPEDTDPLILAINNNKKLLAVLETSPKTGLVISIYDTNTLKKRRSLDVPNACRTKGIAKMKFSNDSRSIGLLTNAPDEQLFLMVLDKAGTILEGSPASGVSHVTIDHIAFNPQDHSIIAVGGQKLLLFLCKAEKGFTVNTNVKVTFTITSMSFLSVDILLVGTSENELVLIENGDFKYSQNAAEADTIDLLWDQEALNKELELKVPVIGELRDSRVVCMTTFARGFCFAIFNKVFVFERISKFKFERKTVLTIPIGIYAEEMYQIRYLALNSKEDTIIVTAMHAQIYVGILIVPETLKTKNLNFETLGVLLHIADIVSVSVCSWKPIIMTASRDQTVRIWNYESEKIELVRKFQVDVNLVELNSTGLMAAIAFSDQLRVTQIFMEELNIVKTYNFARCKAVKYSNLGHMMAAAYDNKISVTSVYNLEILITLKGHNGTVLSVTWSKADKYLFSGGDEGAIYQWDIETGVRVQEIVQKGTEYVGLCVTSNEPISIYAATNFGTLREFQNSEIIRDVAMPARTKCALTDICISRSDMIMFVSNSAGDLVNIQMPIMDTGGGFIPFRFFVSQINKCILSYDGTMLICITKNGTLAIWALDNIEGRVAPLDQDLLKSKEILIPRQLLCEKNEQITNLEVRLKQQAEEFQYQISQNEIFDNQQMADVHRGYCQALEELRNKNNEIEQRHTEEMNQITFQINDLKEEHRLQMENLANQYSERMLIEYQKFSNLRETMLELRESYEEKLKKSAGTLQDTVEGLESDYKTQLDERKELIRELMKEMQDKKVEFIEYCRGVEVENDRNMVEMQLQYENKLTAERNETKMWRGKAGVLQKKYDNLNVEIEKLLEEVEILKEEHQKSQRNIAKLMRNIEDLQKDISDRDYAISTKERRIQELLHKNQELDKYKLVLAHKISELKAQIEPREFQINDKRKHIIELENELAGLNQNNIQLELQLKELKDKYLSNMTELKIERQHSRAARECIQNICTDIYNVAGKINNTFDLKESVKELFQKHANDDELKRFISTDAQVRDEFMRQRAQIERVLQIFKKRKDDNTMKNKYDKLFKENLFLMQELESVKKDNEKLHAALKKKL